MSDLRLRRLVHELNTPVGVSSMAASMLPAQIDSLEAALGGFDFAEALEHL